MTFVSVFYQLIISIYTYYTMCVFSFYHGQMQFYTKFYAFSAIFVNLYAFSHKLTLQQEARLLHASTPPPSMLHEPITPTLIKSFRVRPHAVSDLPTSVHLAFIAYTGI